MGRIYPNKTLTKIEVTRKWEELISRVYQVAGMENIPNVDVFLDDKDSHSNGKKFTSDAMLSGRILDGEEGREGVRRGAPLLMATPTQVRRGA